MSHTLSDRELNRIIYQNAKDAVRQGLMPPKPEDDFGTVMWFTWTFITDEMREAFDLPYLFANRIPVLNDKAFEMLQIEKDFLIANGVIRPEDDYDLHEWAAPEFLEAAMKDEQ